MLPCIVLTHDSADALHGGLAKQVGGLVAIERKRDAAVSDCCGAEELPPSLPAVRRIAPPAQSNLNVYVRHAASLGKGNNSN